MLDSGSSSTRLVGLDKLNERSTLGCMRREDVALVVVPEDGGCKLFTF